MSGFDPYKFANMMDDYIEVADERLKVEYQRELNALRGLTPEQLQEFGGNTTEMDAIIKELELAKEQNLQQAVLVENLKALGESTYALAKKLSALIP